MTVPFLIWQGGGLLIEGYGTVVNLNNCEIHHNEAGAVSALLLNLPLSSSITPMDAYLLAWIPDVILSTTLLHVAGRGRLHFFRQRRHVGHHLSKQLGQLRSRLQQRYTTLDPLDQRHLHRHTLKNAVRPVWSQHQIWFPMSTPSLPGKPAESPPGPNLESNPPAIESAMKSTIFKTLETV